MYGVYLNARKYNNKFLHESYPSSSIEITDSFYADSIDGIVDHIVFIINNVFNKTHTNCNYVRADIRIFNLNENEAVPIDDKTAEIIKNRINEAGEVVDGNEYDIIIIAPDKYDLEFKKRFMGDIKD